LNTSPQDSHADAGDKKRLRRELRDARRSLDDATQSRAAKGLLQQLLTLNSFHDARRIALYLANDGEIDPGEVTNWCQQQGREVYLPLVQRSEGRNWLLFGRLSRDTRFEPNNLGIPEPVLAPSDLLPADELDLVLVPLVGFDERGNRLGMGGGFYDTTFEFLERQQSERPRLVGVAHEIQRVDRIDTESWDIPLPVVVTDCRVLRFQP
jgi:5-formyltetrahydrofolate cyclo-ligase